MRVCVRAVPAAAGVVVSRAGGGANAWAVKAS